MKIILLNGPAGVGKDTLGKLLFDMYHEAGSTVYHGEFKNGLRRVIKGMLSEYHYALFLKHSKCRVAKERPQEYLGGKSPRDFQIWVSEEVIKPTFGDDYFGKLALEYCREARDTIGADVAIFTDSGFEAERGPLVESHDVRTVALHREGFTFEGDSRGYLRYPFVTVILEHGRQVEAAKSIFNFIEGKQ